MGYELICYGVKEERATITINWPRYNRFGIKQMPARRARPPRRRGDSSGRGHRGRRI